MENPCITYLEIDQSLKCDEQTIRKKIHLMSSIKNLNNLIPLKLNEHNKILVGLDKRSKLVTLMDLTDDNEWEFISSLKIYSKTSFVN